MKDLFTQSFAMSFYNNILVYLKFEELKNSTWIEDHSHNLRHAVMKITSDSTTDTVETIASMRFHHSRKLLYLKNAPLYNSQFKGSFQISFWIYFLLNGTQPTSSSCYDSTDDDIYVNSSATVTIE